MRKVILVLMVVCFITLVSCQSKQKTVTGDETIAKEYVETQGYNITSFKGLIETYTLEKSMIYGGAETIKYQQIWGVQEVQPENYFGKEIMTYRFTVKNHPLKRGSVNVYVMISDGKVIGAYSFPDDNSVGGFYSIDGKTLEEVTGLTFQQWSEMWSEKYK